MSEAREELDTTRPQSARMYDYYLGGKDWFEVDREAAERVRAVYPPVGSAARANRAFMHRAMRLLAAEHGMRQFLDIGTGIPTEPNLHQVVQSVAAHARVVYVDHDPLVLEYADALLRGTPEGRTAYVEADFRVDDLLSHPRVVDVLDLTRPLVLSLVALLHFVGDAEDPHGMVRRVIERLPQGSWLVLTHATDEFDPAAARRGEEIYRGGGTEFRLRPREEIVRFFDGLELLDPGVALAHRWRPEGISALTDYEVSAYVGVARKG